MGEDSRSSLVDDVCMNADKDHVSLCLLLDLSAVFNTVDHVILFRCLEAYVLIKGSALNWLNHYLWATLKDLLLEASCHQST